MLGIITARAGSQGVPGKNKALIAGRPMIDYSVAALQAAPSITGILITTADQDILDFYIGNENILLVERPAELSTSEATSNDVVSHALECWESAGNRLPSEIFLAQPTSPLRDVNDIENACSMFIKSDNESLISCCLAEGMRHPRDMYRVDSTGKSELFIHEQGSGHRRSEYESLYQRNGAIYIVSTEYFLRTNLLRSESPIIYEMPWERSINVDVPGDLLIAKALIESGLVDS